MQAYRRFLCFLLLSTISMLCAAQLDTRPRSALDTQSLGAPVPLTQDQAFPFYVSETGPNQYRISWTPAPGHYLYRHAFQFSLQQGNSSPGQTLVATLPDGLHKTDQFFGDIEAYYERVSADITLPDNTPESAVLLIQYQGCADWGFCYPPQRREFPLQP